MTSTGIDEMNELLLALFRLFNPWLAFFEQKPEDLPRGGPDDLARLRQRRLRFIPGDPLPDDSCDGWCADDLACQWPDDPHCHQHPRRCHSCYSTEYLMDERARCWDCNDEIQRERAIEDRANRRGQRY